MMFGKMFPDSLHSAQHQCLHNGMMCEAWPLMSILGKCNQEMITQLEKQ
jgi:hypothetical protein